MHIYGRDSVSPAPRALDHVLSDSWSVKLLPTKNPIGLLPGCVEPSALEVFLDEEDDVSRPPC